MKAIILFSGGKDSVMSLLRARKNGINIVGAIRIYFGASENNSVLTDVSSDIVQAVASSLGIVNFKTHSMDLDLMIGDYTNIMWYNAIKEMKDMHPDVDTLIVGADASQIANMQLFYCRLAHALNMSVYVPYMNDYDPEFINDLIEEECLLKIVYATPYAVTPYSIGDVLTPQDVADALINGNHNVYSRLQTVVINGKSFAHAIDIELNQSGIFELV